LALQRSSNGPAAFNATLSAKGGSVVSLDPIYRFSAQEIRSRVDETAATIADELRENADEFIWTRFSSVEEVVRTRLKSMDEFLADYPVGQSSGRYIDGSLPSA
jgi:hypothetical protein